MRHQCLIYDGAPSTQLPRLAAVAAARLHENYRCLFLNSPAMVAGFRSCLAAAGVRVAEVVERGALVLSVSQEHLDNGQFDTARMLAALKQAHDDALNDGYDGLWATGDMLWELGGAQNFDRLLEYECGLESLLQETPTLCGICQYHRSSLPANALQEALYTHSSVFLNSTLSRINPYFLQAATLRLRGLAPDDTLTEMLKTLELPLKG